MGLGYLIVLVLSTMEGKVDRLNSSYSLRATHDSSDDSSGEGGDFGNSLGRVSLGKEKKLLVIHLNGLLAHIFFPSEDIKIPSGRRPDGKVGKKLVFKRPYCDDFIQFCFERFVVGIWASATKRNVDGAINIVFGNLKHKLMFIWGQKDCTMMEVENADRPVFLKELKKLWNSDSLPWPKGRYTASNTLLIDGSPDRAILNPPNSAIFPEPYLVEIVNNDKIGPNQELRLFLEEIAEADDVPTYVKCHSIGQRARRSS